MEFQLKWGLFCNAGGGEPQVATIVIKVYVLLICVKTFVNYKDTDVSLAVPESCTL